MNWLPQNYIPLDFRIKSAMIPSLFLCWFTVHAKMLQMSWGTMDLFLFHTCQNLDQAITCVQCVHPLDVSGIVSILQYLPNIKHLSVQVPAERNITWGLSHSNSTLLCLTISLSGLEIWMKFMLGTQNFGRPTCLPFDQESLFLRNFLRRSGDHFTILLNDL